MTADRILVAEFTVPGEPRAKARPRVTRNGTYTPKATKEYEARVQTAWASTPRPDYDMSSAFRLDVDFYLGTRRQADRDNLLKCVKDALNKQAYTDDHLVYDGRERKWFTTKERARTEVRLYVIDGDRTEVA